MIFTPPAGEERGRGDEPAIAVTLDESTVSGRPGRRGPGRSRGGDALLGLPASGHRSAAIVLNLPGRALRHGVSKVRIAGFGASWGRSARLRGHS
jgi:hypothetical protein